MFRSKRANLSGGGGSYTPPTNNLTGTGAPTTSNDITEGYEVNSLWFDTSASPVNVYRCVDNTEDNAVWVETTAEASDLDTWLATKTTNDLSENTNLYFTDGRVDDHLSGGTGIDYSSGTISIDSTVTQNSDTDVSGTSWVLDQDDLSGDDDTKVPTQQSVKAYVDNNIYSDSDVDDYLSGGTGIDYSSGTISIADNGVTLAKMASGTDGNLITFDSNGDPAYVSTGTAVQVLTSNGAGSAPTFQDASGGGSGLPQLLPDNMSLDSTDSESSRGSAFSMVETINFSSNGSTDGSVWITFEFPSSLDASSDINLKLVYNLSGADNSKTVVFKTSYWVYGDNDTPNSASPDGTNTDNISTGTSENDKRQSEILTAIPNASLSTGNTITLRFTRESSSGSDTYTGTLQLLYIFPYQS